MSKEIKQKAYELVDLFVDLKLKDNNDIYIIPYPEDAIIVAIKHQKRLIDACRCHFHRGTDYLEEQKAILTELQYRL